MANFVFGGGPKGWGARRGGGPEGVGARRGGGPNPEKVGPEGLGAEGWGPKGGGPKFRAFFALSRHNLHSFFSLWGFSRGILVVFEAPGRSNVHVWALGLSCGTPAAPPDRRPKDLKT